MNYRKHLLLFASLFFTAVCFFTACTKKTITPTHTNYNPDGIGPGTGPGGVTGGDTTGTADSLASFNAPTGLAVDVAGNIYVADYGNNLIRKITTNGTVSTLAGTGNQGSIDGQGNQASFNGPTSLAVDGSGNIYVADDNNNRIRKITPAGLVSTLAGADSAGFANGTGTSAYFFGPSGIAVDGTGKVYVADAGNNLIRLISPAGVVTTFAGNGNAGATNGSLLSASFNNPAALALDASGNVFVADLLNNMVRQINTSGTVSTLAGNGNTGSADSAGSAATFYFPNSLAVDGTGNIYVTEYVTNLIRKITPDGTVSTFAGNGEAGQADSTGTAASFDGPSGIAIDAVGNLYIADTYNNVIRKITPAGVASTIAGSGFAGSLNGKALASLKKQHALKALLKTRRVTHNTLYNILVKKHLLR